MSKQERVDSHHHLLTDIAINDLKIPQVVNFKLYHPVEERRMVTDTLDDLAEEFERAYPNIEIASDEYFDTMLHFAKEQFPRRFKTVM